MCDKLSETKCAGSGPDPWANRSKGMRCKSCMFFVVKATLSPASVAVGQIGRCRRHAPTMTGYPVVFENDWCGDHKLNENVYRTMDPQHYGAKDQISMAEAVKLMTER